MVVGINVFFLPVLAPCQACVFTCGRELFATRAYGVIPLSLGTLCLCVCCVYDLACTGCFEVYGERKEGVRYAAVVKRIVYVSDRFCFSAVMYDG